MFKNLLTYNFLSFGFDFCACRYFALTVERVDAFHSPLLLADNPLSVKVVPGDESIRGLCDMVLEGGVLQSGHNVDSQHGLETVRVFDLADETVHAVGVDDAIPKVRVLAPVLHTLGHLCVGKLRAI